MQGVTTTSATSVTANVLTGQQFERVPGPLKHKIILVASGIDGSVDDHLITFTVGGRVVMPEGAVAINAAGPANDSDEIAQAVGNPGDQLTLRHANSNAAARILGWRIVLKPLMV
tara:strand:+ start:1026 stop:1370 length:345 start_codon:yes stop_codon:yes gene_type:complete